MRNVLLLRATMNGAMPVGSLGEYPCPIGSIDSVFSVELAGIEPATPCLVGESWDGLAHPTSCCAEFGCGDVGAGPSC